MSGFRKARPEQAALKMSMYGPPGSGKTFTALLLAEGLAAASGKRVAVVDTERGTDFYAQPVEARTAHPAAFDFDALYTRSLTEVVSSCLSLRPEEHAVCVIDSMTHLWQAAMAAYTGRRTKQDGIPLNAWGKIKEPYKRLMAWVVNSPLHVIILGRQGQEFAEDEESGEMKPMGTKMKAEGETQYEPHICIRMEGVKTGGGPRGKGKVNPANAVPTAFVEKDRSGVLQGAVIPWPAFETLAKPLLPLLGATQAQQQSEDEAAAQDAEAIAEQDRRRAKASADQLQQLTARLTLARSAEEVKQIGQEITPAVKKSMLPEHVEQLRGAFLDAQKKAKETNGQPQ